MKKNTHVSKTFQFCSIVPLLQKQHPKTPRDDIRQTVALAEVIVQRSGVPVDDETYARCVFDRARKTLCSERDFVLDTLRRVEMDEIKLPYAGIYDHRQIDVSAVTLAVLKKLPDPDGWIFRRCFLRGDKQKDVAASLGVSPASVSLICKRCAQAFIREYTRAANQ